MKPAEAIEAIASALRNVPRVRALFLSGSYGAGIEDAFSDIDFLAVTADSLDEKFRADWREAVGKAGEIILWWGHAKQHVITAITDRWLRVDVEVVASDQAFHRAKANLKLLFDHDRIFDTLPDETEKTKLNAAGWRWQFENFIRVLGLMSVAIGREDYLTGVTGIFHLRNMLIDLLIAETDAANRGGALHLHRLITEEQKALLASMPAPVPTREAVIEANLAYAAAYLPRARRMAAELDLDWPERFEAATWAHLKRQLAIERPDF